MDTKIILLLLLLLPIVQGQIAIDSFETSPPFVAPGEEMDLTLEIENVGSKTVNNVLVALDLTQLPLATIGSSTEKIIDRIRRDDSELVVFRIRALPTAVPNIYKIPVTIAYEGISKTSLLSVEVSARPQMDIIMESPAPIKIGDRSEINFKFVNKGLIPIHFLTVTLQESEGYELVNSKSAYIGEVDVGDFETEEFTLISKVKNPSITVNLFYRDTNNKDYNATKVLPLKVYTPEEAQQLGLIENKNTSLIIAGMVILALLLFFIYRKIRKKRKNEQH